MQLNDSPEEHSEEPVGTGLQQTDRKLGAFEQRAAAFCNIQSSHSWNMVYPKICWISL